MDRETLTQPPPVQSPSQDFLGLWDRLTRMETRLPYELRLLDQKFASQIAPILLRLEGLESIVSVKARQETPIDAMGWIKVAAAVFLLVSGLIAIATGSVEPLVRAGKAVQSLR